MNLKFVKKKIKMPLERKKLIFRRKVLARFYKLKDAKAFCC